MGETIKSMETQQNQPIIPEIPQQPPVNHSSKLKLPGILLIAIGVLLLLGFGAWKYVSGMKNTYTSNATPQNSVSKKEDAVIAPSNFFFGTITANDVTNYVIENAQTGEVLYQLPSPAEVLKQFGYIHAVSLSPDNQFIGIVSVKEGNSQHQEVITTISTHDYKAEEIYSQNLPNGKIYFPGFDSVQPLPLVWSSDSKYIFFLSADGEKQDIAMVNVATKEQKQITSDGKQKYNIVSSPLDDKVLFMERDTSDQYGTYGSYFVYALNTNQLSKITVTDPSTQKMLGLRPENDRQKVVFLGENTILFPFASTFLKEKDDPALFGIWKVNILQGNAEHLVVKPLDPNAEVTVSPDGNFVSFTQLDTYGAEGQNALYSTWILNLQNKQLTKLVSKNLSGFVNLGWSPDSSMFAFGSRIRVIGAETYSLYSAKTNSSKQILEAGRQSDHVLEGKAWSPDSQSLLIRDYTDNVGNIKFSSNTIVSKEGNVLQKLSNPITPIRWFVTK